MVGFRGLRGARLGILERSETGLTGLGDFVGTLTWGCAPGFGRPALQALVAGGQWELGIGNWELGIGNWR
jgi:hypothetical protein